MLWPMWFIFLNIWNLRTPASWSCRVLIASQIHSWTDNWTAVIHEKNGEGEDGVDSILALHKCCESASMRGAGCEVEKTQGATARARFEMERVRIAQCYWVKVGQVRWASAWCTQKEAVRRVVVSSSTDMEAALLLWLLLCSGCNSFLWRDKDLPIAPSRSHTNTKVHLGYRSYCSIRRWCMWSVCRVWRNCGRSLSWIHWSSDRWYHSFSFQDIPQMLFFK